ncbi:MULTISPECIES: DMT family transporter [unclassified Streptomyces]|uniref:DMT family transporter n=1 Tax=unclassified Streptomyces TaxID=2593676 RepID=UPI001CBEB71D|nr:MULTISPECIES: DMT family transporter [unclassified Streptomyces]WPO73332.1 DMT family transporter [Streptomyces sp. KN37]
MNQNKLLLRTALGPTLGGTSYLVAQYLPPSPYWDAVLRAAPAGLLLLALKPALPKGTWWWRSLVVGALNIGFFFGLLFVSAQRLSSGVSATIGALSTLFAIGFAVPVLRERIRPVQYVAAVIGVCGVALLVFRGDSSLDALGVVAGLGSALSLGLGSVLSRRWGRPEGIGGITFASWTLLGGSAVLLPIALLAEGAPPSITLSQLGGLAWVAFGCSALAYYLLLSGLQALPISLSAPLPLLGPVSAGFFGWLIAGETLAPLQLLGGAIVLGSVLGATWPRKPKATVEAVPDAPLPTTEAEPPAPLAGRR